MKEKFRHYILQNLAFGLFALIPIFGSIYVFFIILSFSDNFLFNLLPDPLRPHNLFGVHIPGLGIILTITIICITGVLTRNYLGKEMIAWVERQLSRVPILSTFFRAFRQVTESVFMDRSNSFRKVVMIEFPKEGIYTVAFVTHSFKNSIPNSTAYQEMYTVFVPTTPNPTSGFFMIVPDWAAHDLNMNVQEAFRLIVSCGILAGGASDLSSRLEQAIHSSVKKRQQEETK